MKAGLLLLLFVCMVVVSCQNRTGKCSPCPVYPLAASQFASLYIRVRIVDKVSGADLFLSPTSPYKPSDLAVSSSVNGPNVTFYVDSTTEKDTPFIRLISPESQTFTLKLASLSPNILQVVLANDSPKCCPVTRIKSITLDNVRQCGPCSFAQLVTIKK